MYCKACHKYQRITYRYRLTNATDDTNIVLLIKESMSISSIARYLKMAKTTVGRRILKISHRIPYPMLSETNQIYEVDEMQTYIGRRQISCHVYITYAINRITKTVADFIIGPRTKETIGKLIARLLFLTPKKIYTYKSNVIERNNLSIRNSLKRLSRKTICYSKNILMLEACLKICFWYNNSLGPTVADMLHR